MNASLHVSVTPLSTTAVQTLRAASSVDDLAPRLVALFDRASIDPPGLHLQPAAERCLDIARACFDRAPSDRAELLTAILHDAGIA